MNNSDIVYININCEILVIGYPVKWGLNVQQGNTGTQNISRPIEVSVMMLIWDQYS